MLAALQSLHAQGQISAATYTADLNAWNQALVTESGLTGTPALELGAVVANVNQIAMSGLLTSSRLPEVFLTVSPGAYTVTLSATDLAGNVGTSTETLTVQ